MDTSYKNCKPQISVIVPVYKVEKYIRQCVDSIIKQTFSNIEVILVNDGSPDDSGKICDEYAHKDGRVSVIHKENGGVSSARNQGLSVAKGEWITFVDPDDWIEHDALEIGLITAEKYNADILGWNHYNDYENRQEKHSHINPTPIIREGKANKWLLLNTMFPEYDTHISGVSTSVIRGACLKLFKKGIILDNNITFSRSLKIGEDALFCMQCFENAEKVVLVDKYLYHYRVVEESANRRFRIDAKEIYLNQLKAFKDQLGDRMNQKEYRICYTGMVGESIYNCLAKYYGNKQNTNSFMVKIKELKELLENEILIEALADSDSSSCGIPMKLVIRWAKTKNALLLYSFQMLRNMR